MSKISVTTIAGLTSGGDANTVKIESGDDFVVDTDVLKVDASNNRVGIGTTSPAMGLHISGSASSNNYGMRVVNSDASGYSTIQMGDVNAGMYRNGSSQTQYGGASSLNLITVSGHPISFATSNTVRMKIDGSGNVTTPNQPSFQAKSNVSNLTLSNYAGATYHLNIFNNEFFDIGSHYNTTNSTFTAPVAGRYYFYTQLQLSGSPTTSDHSWGINLHFQVNGAGNHANGYQSLSTNQGGGSTTLFGSYGLASKENILNLAANDTVRVALSGNGNINAGTIETVTNDGRCRFGGHLLG